MPALWIGHHRKNACPLFIVKSEFQGYNEGIDTVFTINVTNTHVKEEHVYVLLKSGQNDHGEQVRLCESMMTVIEARNRRDAHKC